jgi:hypothetical protein
MHTSLLYDFRPSDIDDGIDWQADRDFEQRLAEKKCYNDQELLQLLALHECYWITIKYLRDDGNEMKVSGKKGKNFLLVNGLRRLSARLWQPIGHPSF